MSNTKDTQFVASPASSQASSTQQPRVRGLVGRGLLAAVAAASATTLVAALAKSAGVGFEIPDGGETIPLSGIAFVTGVFSVVGVIIAAALLRWITQPVKRFVQVAVTLTAISLVPPFLSGAAPRTVAALIALHLAAGAVMIPTLARNLRTMVPHPCR